MNSYKSNWEKLRKEINSKVGGELSSFTKNFADPILEQGSERLHVAKLAKNNYLKISFRI